MLSVIYVKCRKQDIMLSVVLLKVVMLNVVTPIPNRPFQVSSTNYREFAKCSEGHSDNNKKERKNKKYFRTWADLIKPFCRNCTQNGINL
jgi:hypothetical protein